MSDSLVASAVRPVGRAWRSPTVMTWFSFLTKSLSYVTVVPLILTKLHASDIALWYVFVSIMSLQLLADWGFAPTFVRVIAYAMGGARSDQLSGRRSVDRGAGPNWSTVATIVATMRVVYVRITVVAVLVVATLGTAAVLRPIGASPDRVTATLAWLAVVAGSGVGLRGQLFAAYLQGVNQVALVRRWEALTNLGAIASSFVVLLLGGGLLGLVLSHQVWILINVLRNRFLARYVQDGKFREFGASGFDPHVFRVVWGSAWRSGTGILLGQAPIQFSGLFFAQVGTPGAVAMYLFALNLLSAIRSFAAAPFYSKIPVLSRLRAEGRLADQATIAARGMRLSHTTFAILLIGAGFGGPPLLALIGSKAEFAPSPLWALLGVGMFLERYGAMHLHLYSTTNHVVWHIANGVTGVLFVGMAAVLFPVLELTGLAVAYVMANATFYSWYCARLSYRALGTSLFEFEKRSALLPSLAVAAFAAASFVLAKGGP